MKTQDKFSSPTPVPQLDIAFGGSIKDLLPGYETIPQEFKSGRTKWNQIVSTWFFRGLPAGTVFTPKDGIDALRAKAHVKAVLVSFEPKHEHKEAGAAYLLSKWFDDIQIPVEAKP